MASTRILMAFLTRKEQSLIKLINTNTSLQTAKKRGYVNQINYNARLRQDGYRPATREFIQAMANHGVETIFKSIQND